MDVIKYRSASPGLLIPIIFPLSIRLIDTNPSSINLLIVEYFTCFVVLVHFLRTNVEVTSEQIEKFYFISYLVPIVFKTFHGFLYTIPTLISFTIPLVHFKVVKSFPNTFTFGEGLFLVQIFLHGISLLIQDFTFTTFSNNGTILSELWKEKICSLVYWSVCLCISAGVMCFSYKQKSGHRASTLERKYFHFLFLFLYIPHFTSGSDRRFLYISSALLCGVFILTEVIRFNKIPIFGKPFTTHLVDAFEKFRGSKDEGKLLLTPLYLLIGITLPLWIVGLDNFSGEHFFDSNEYIGVLAGIVSICIGDSFASIGGQGYLQFMRSYSTVNNNNDKLTVNSNEKTYVGLIFNILSQIVCFVVLSFTGTYIGNSSTHLSLFLAIILNSIFEKLTDQNDNLIVPLLTFVTYLFLSKILV